MMKGSLKFNLTIFTSLAIICAAGVWSTIEHSLGEREKSEQDRLITDRMELEQHHYIVEVSSDKGFDIILPTVIDAAKYQSQLPGVSNGGAYPRIEDGKCNFTIVSTEYGCGLRVSGSGHVKLESSISSEYYYDYYTGELRIVRGSPIFSSLTYSFPRIWSSTNDSTLAISLEYKTSTTGKMGGVYTTMMIESCEIHNGWNDMEVHSLKLHAP
jgi:hypothetical protein